MDSTHWTRRKKKMKNITENMYSSMAMSRIKINQHTSTMNIWHIMPCNWKTNHNNLRITHNKNVLHMYSIDNIDVHINTTHICIPTNSKKKTFCRKLCQRVYTGYVCVCVCVKIDRCEWTHFQFHWWNKLYFIGTLFTYSYQTT